MLSVSFSLASLISMLMSIALGVEFELDSLNDPTTHPIVSSFG